jgi:crossover junction endodeoxyribonuclease RuvC
VSSRQRILGIDPGSRITGFGILDFEGDKPVYVTSGTVKSQDGSFADRLKRIYLSIGEIVAEYQPDIVAVETVFMARNAGSALKLGQARSAALCATFAYELEVHEYAPREIKQAVVGTGAATKEQVQHMIVAMLQLNATPSADAADALATAICHGHKRALRIRLGDHVIVANLR